MTLRFLTSCAVTAVVALVLCSTPVEAQHRFDVSLLGGWTKANSEGSVLEFNYGTVYEASLAWRISGTDRLDAAIEIPFLAANSLSVKTPGASLPREYAALSLTPGIRVMAAVRPNLSVFGAVGGGFASYEESALREDGSPNPGNKSNTTGAVAFGGGIDVRSGSWLGLRGEVRSVIAGARQFSIATPRERARQLVIALGLVARF